MTLAAVPVLTQFIRNLSNHEYRYVGVSQHLQLLETRDLSSATDEQLMGRQYVEQGNLASGLHPDCLANSMASLSALSERGDPSYATIMRL